MSEVQVDPGIVVCLCVRATATTTGADAVRVERPEGAACVVDECEGVLERGAEISVSLAVGVVASYVRRNA
ncbi:hypothetical protein [Rhodococcus qingshengii]|uniref:hypothetical protein n=1 Tax=Rhodococcus qingshengii TaxID=334542 RepID=UPI001ADEF6A9|nr:hypothetical protein [Rhodococcus qingshengii]